MTTGTWAMYLATLREIHAARATAADRGEATQEVLRARAQQLEEFAQQVRKQEKRVVSLAYDLRKPVRFVPTDVTDPAASRPWDEAVEDFEERIHAADGAIEDARHFGYRPQLLPDWPAWARSGAVYFVLSLPSVVLNWALWLAYASDEGMGGEFTVAAWGCCFWPIVAVACGIVVIRIVGSPRLKNTEKGEFEQRKEAEVPLHIQLGIAISVGASVLSIALVWLLQAAFGG